MDASPARFDQNAAPTPATAGTSAPAGAQVTSHRGALAELAGEQREEAVRAALLGRAPRPEHALKDARRDLLDQLCVEGEPETSAPACFETFSKDLLTELAHALELKGVSKLRKAELAASVVQELAQRPDLITLDLVSCDDVQYALALRLLEEGPLVFDASEPPADALSASPLVPYIYMFRHDGRVTTLIPDELAAAMRALDFAAIDTERAQSREALLFADTAVSYFGIVTLDEAYTAYVEAVEQPLTDDAFLRLLGSEAGSDEVVFELAKIGDVLYLVHYLLGEGYTASLVASRGEGPSEEELADTLRGLEDARAGILAEQARHTRRPLAGLVREDPFAWVYECPEACNLRAYLDEHVPDGDDDYTFADGVVDAVVEAVTDGARIADVLGGLADQGLPSRGDDPQLFCQLVTNLYNAVPQWELFGWSARETLETATGQRVFFDESGAVLKVGRNDPCPCGSGKKYKKCCGRPAGA